MYCKVNYYFLFGKKFLLKNGHIVVNRFLTIRMCFCCRGIREIVTKTAFLNKQTIQKISYFFKDKNIVHEYLFIKAVCLLV